MGEGELDPLAEKMTWKLSAPGGRVGRGGEFTFKGCSNPGSDSCTAG